MESSAYFGVRESDLNLSIVLVDIWFRRISFSIRTKSRITVRSERQQPVEGHSNVTSVLLPKHTGQHDILFNYFAPRLRVETVFGHLILSNRRKLKKITRQDELQKMECISWGGACDSGYKVTGCMLT
jgi:hypothetical protein